MPGVVWESAHLSATMHLIVVLLCSLSLTAIGQEVDNDLSAINWDTQCLKEVEQLKIMQPTCIPVFKQFIKRLLREIEKVGWPVNAKDLFFDAKIKLSTQDMTEIKTFLNCEDNCITGALDSALSQILVDIRPHDNESWRWRFEETFGVELDTIQKMAVVVLLVVAIVCTQLWSKVSWFMQFGRLFAFSFVISVIWNWYYLYQIALAEHQSNLAKMDSLFAECTGVKKPDWGEWFRSIWTLQDDPCKKHHELLLVDPILMVPPSKALTVTITTFFTNPLKHIGQGMNEFLVALLKNLPLTLQIPVLITVILAILVCMYAGVHAFFQHGITALFRRTPRDPPPPQLEQPWPHIQEIEDNDHVGWEHTQQHAPREQGNVGRLHTNQVRHQQSNRKQPVKEVVETLGIADPPYSGDETDAMQQEAELNLSAEPENLHETQADRRESVASAANSAQTNINSTVSGYSPTTDQPVEVNKKLSKDQLSKDSAAPTPPKCDVQDTQQKTQPGLLSRPNYGPEPK